MYQTIDDIIRTLSDPAVSKEEKHQIRMRPDLRFGPISLTYHEVPGNPNMIEVHCEQKVTKTCAPS